MAQSDGAGPWPILVVDDEKDIRDLIRDTLEIAGHEVLEAADGDEVVGILHAHRLGLVLLDVMMPTVDGWGALERIRDLSDVPVVMLTARSLERDRMRALRAGADEYLVKPFSPLELTTLVQALLAAGRGRHRAGVYDDGFVRVDGARRQVHAGGREVSVTAPELRLLTLLISERDGAIGTDRIIDLVWGRGARQGGDEVAALAGELARKLGPRADGASPIEVAGPGGYAYVRPARRTGGGMA